MRTLALVLVLVAGAAEATSIVAVGDANSIVLAADSRTLHFDGCVEATCKVSCGGRFAFAQSGVRPDPPSIAEIVASRAGAGAGSADEAARRYVEMMSGCVWFTVANGTPPEIDRILAESGKAFEVIVIGMEGGEPRVVVGRVPLARRAGNVAGWDLLPPTFESPVGRHLNALIGEVGALNARGDEWRARLTWLSPIDQAARTMVGAEIDARPDIVGPPVAVLCIDAGGPRWLHPGACE